MQICDEFNLDDEKGIVYHNLGSLYGTMSYSEDAIRYYKKSIKFKTDEDSPLISILCLVVEYSKMNDQKFVNYWCDQGLRLLSQLEENNLTSYHYHFNIFKSLHSEQGLSERITQQAIDYFKTVEDYQYVHKYSIALAEWYYSNRKYKLSAIYFQEANKFGYIYRKTKTWEDL